MAIKLRIRKKANNVWVHVKVETTLEIIISKFHAVWKGTIMEVTENTANDLLRYDISEIAVHDDTNGGGEELFVTPLAMSQRLKILGYTAFYDDANLVIADLISGDVSNAIVLGSDGKLYATTGVAVNGLPVGGTTGQKLAKQSNTNFDAIWVDDSAGDGTVTSVAQSVPTGLQVAGSPITAAGTLAITYQSGYQGYTTSEATKLGHITVTQAVNLDQMETDIAALANGMVYKGNWDASIGTFPGGGLAKIGWFYYVSVSGTVGGVDFAIGDNIVATVDNASTTVYAANWSKHDQTDAVQSVVGLTGSISKSGLLAALNVEDGADVTDAINIGTSINGATSKTTPVDADTLPIIDSAASNVLKKVTWANIKATLLAYFNTVYLSIANFLEQKLIGDILHNGSASGAIAVDLSLYAFVNLAASAAITITESNTPATNKTFIRQYRITGSHTITLPAGWSALPSSQAYDGTKNNLFTVDYYNVNGTLIIKYFNQYTA